MITLLKKLIKTAPYKINGELRITELLNDFFTSKGLKSKVDIWDDNRANITVHLQSSNPKRPPLVFAGHIDVVPADKNQWDTDPFEPIESNGRIIGRGAVDMLGGLVASAQAVVDIFQSHGNQLQGDLIFSGSAGEETDSCGALRFIKDFGPKIGRPMGVIIPEPTHLELLRAHRGILWLNIETFGKTAHGSMPQMGVNAILKINEIINRLRDYQIPHQPHPDLGGCSLSLNRISGGTGTNIIPDHCTLEADIRTLPGQDHQLIISDLKTVIDNVAENNPDFRYDVSVIRSVPAMETAGDDRFVKDVLAAIDYDTTGAVGFTTDGPIFAKLGGPVLIIGPGDPTLCHKPNEFIETTDLQKAKTLYEQIINKLLIE